MFTSEEEHFLEAQQVFTDVMIIDSCLLDMSWCQVQGQAPFCLSRANYPGYILTSGPGWAFNMDLSLEGEQCQDAAELWLWLECSFSALKTQAGSEKGELSQN